MSAKEELQAIKDGKNFKFGPDEIEIINSGKDLSKEVETEEPKSAVEEVKKEEEKPVEPTAPISQPAPESKAEESHALAEFSIPTPPINPEPVVPQPSFNFGGNATVDDYKLPGNDFGFNNYAGGNDAVSNQSDITIYRSKDDVDAVYDMKVQAENERHENAINEIEADRQRDYATVNKLVAYDRMVRNMTDVSRFEDPLPASNFSQSMGDNNRGMVA